jgi:hypothetical protein
MSEDESSSGVFDEYGDDFHLDFHTKRKQKHKIFVKKVKKQSIYDVKDSQHELVKKINSLEIPERSKQLLTKLVVNRQLEGIKSVRKGSNSVILHAKVNHEHENYRDLESNEVMMKIFIGKNHKKANVESANNFKIRSLKVDTAYRSIKRESLDLLTSENIKVMKIVGVKHPAKNLLEMLEENPQKVRKYFREVFEALKVIIYYYFWIEKASMTDILWHQGRWVFLDRIDSSKNEEDTNTAANIALLFKTFLEFGMTTYEIQQEFTSILTHLDRSYYHSRSKTANLLTTELVEYF